jgi:hypothetical protein
VQEMSDHEWDMYLRGCEDPRTLAVEAQDQFEEDCIREQDDMESRGGPVFRIQYPDDEIPW